MQNQIGKILLEDGHLEQARARFDEAMMIAKASGDAAGKALSSNNLGLYYVNKSDPQNALAQYRIAAGLMNELRDVDGLTMVMINVGEVYLRAGKTTQAQVYFDKARTNVLSSTDRSSALQRLNKIADIYIASGQSADAVAYLYDALEIARETGNRRLERKISDQLEKLQRS